MHGTVNAALKSKVTFHQQKENVYTYSGTPFECIVLATY